MKDDIVERFLPKNLYQAKFLFLSYGPKLSWPIRLQTFLNFNISKKHWAMKLILCVYVDIHGNFMLVILFYVSICMYIYICIFPSMYCIYLFVVYIYACMCVSGVCVCQSCGVDLCMQYMICISLCMHGVYLSCILGIYLCTHDICKYVCMIYIFT